MGTPWNEWSQYVLEAIKDLKDDDAEQRRELTKLRELIHDVRADLRAMKMRVALLSGVCGTLGGALVMTLLRYFVLKS